MTPQEVQHKFADASNQYQQKYLQFSIGLTFSMLVLSVTNPIITELKVLSCVEFFGWVSLLTSGVIGLRRFEIYDLLYNLAAKNVEGKLPESEKERMIKIENEQVRRVVHQRWSFLIGVIALMLARGYFIFQ